MAVQGSLRAIVAAPESVSVGINRIGAWRTFGASRTERVVRIRDADVMRWIQGTTTGHADRIRPVSLRFMRGNADTLHLLQVETVSRPREYVRIAQLLHDASDRVIHEARLRSLAIIVIAPNDEVFVSRVHVAFILAAMLGSAIERTPPNGRLAITGHEVERELSIAVYAPGPAQPGSSATDDIARIHAEALGGRFWRSNAPDGTLAMFVLPLYLDEN